MDVLEKWNEEFKKIVNDDKAIIEIAIYWDHGQSRYYLQAFTNDGKFLPEGRYAANDSSWDEICDEMWEEFKSNDLGIEETISDEEFDEIFDRVVREEIELEDSDEEQQLYRDLDHDEFLLTMKDIKEFHEDLVNDGAEYSLEELIKDRFEKVESREAWEKAVKEGQELGE